MNNAKVIVMAVGLMILGAATYGITQQAMYAIPPTTPRVIYILGDGMGDRVVIRASMPNDANICAEPEKGVVMCRTVAEFRVWATERPLQTKWKK